MDAKTFFSGFFLGLSLIVAIGAQNAHVLRMGLLRKQVLVTVLACAVSDLILIFAGVLGLAQLGELSKLWRGLLIGGAIVFLLHYGFKAAHRAWKSSGDALQAASVGAPATAGKALAQAMAFTWLNPHVWLDTAVLLGTASLAYQPPAHLVFATGAGTASIVWFVVLGFGAAALAKRLSHPGVWRALDVLVALTMWGTAAWLAWGLLKA